MSQFQKKITNQSNICSCGKHEGIGECNPYERAQMYNWFRERYPIGYEPHYREYLESYERAHGRLGVESFLFNDSKFKDYDKVKAAYRGLSKAKIKESQQEGVQYWNEP